MFKNLLKSTFLYLWKDKGYTLLNVLGLTTGIIFSVFLLLYIFDELSYDRYNKSAESIYRISGNAQEPKQFLRQASTPFPLRDIVSTGYPEVEASARLVPWGPGTFKIGSHIFNEEKIFFSDPEVFKVFTFPLLEGDPGLALKQPNSIVISATMAGKYFGNPRNAMGKTLYYDVKNSFLITGVMADIPHNSHIQLHALISRSTLPKDYSNYWGSFGNFTYVRLKEGTSAAAFETKLALVADQHLNTIFRPAHVKIVLQLQPVTAIHLHSLDMGEPEELGNVSYLYIFSIVAISMLVIACINYINMSTARSSRRAREVGIRKVSGSTSLQLIMQFILESVLVSMVSILFACMGLVLLLPAFNLISGKSLEMASLIQPEVQLVMLGIFLFCGVLAGSYPAIYLARYNTVDVLKGNLSRGRRGIILRKSLVVFQFAISMIMLVSTWIIYDQLTYLRNKDLGFNKNQVLTLHVKDDVKLMQRIPSYLAWLNKLPGVLSTATAASVPGMRPNFSLLGVETGSGVENRGIDNYSIDKNYLGTLGIKIVQGRNFNGTPADTGASVLVNVRLVEVFGWKTAIGKQIRNGDQTNSKVIGVFSNFNQASLYNPIEPLVLNYYPVNQTVLVKLRPEGLNSAIAALGSSWSRFFPELPFEYQFIDRQFGSQYKADEQRGQIFSTFSALTIGISCLGLLGLVGFTTAQRSKEISIRKVLGAGAGVLMGLLIREFMVLILIATIIALPVAWFSMHKWLSVFPYHTEINWISFLLSFGMLALVTFLTVSYHTIRTSLANPVKNLRSE